MTVTALLVEDDELLRSALSMSLRTQGIRIVGSLPTAEGVLELAQDRQPDVALLDLDLGPGPSGIDIAHALRRELPQIGLVILTTYADPRLKSSDLTSLPPGTRYLNKNSADDVTAVADALAGAARAPHASTPRSDRPAQIDLTTAQIDVLRLVAEGLTNSQIAERRGVTVNAVEQMLSKMYQRLEVPADAAANQRVLLVRAYLKGAGRLD